MLYEKKKLMDCCESIFDGDHMPPPKSSDGIPFITISNIDSNNKISFDDVMYVPKSYYDALPATKKARKGDILYTVVGSFGIPVYIEEDIEFVFQRHIAILRPNETVNGKFLYYVMLNPQFYKMIDKLAIGCSQRTVTLDTLRNLEIDVPDLETQNKIVDVLSSLDKQMNLNLRMIENLQEQTKLIYDYWFNQFEFPNKDGKPYKSSGGGLYYNETLKQYIPIGWQDGVLSDIVYSVNTGLNPRQNFVLGEGDIKYITVKNLTKMGLLDFSGCDVITEESKDLIHKRSDVSKGDILFASIAPLGRCFLVQEPPVDWEINESVFSIRPIPNVPSEYLYMFFTNDSFVKVASNSSTGSIFKGIRVNTLLDIACLIPHESVLNSFADKVKDILFLKYKIELENQKLQKYRDWLLPMLMNGQITIE